MKRLPPKRVGSVPLTINKEEQMKAAVWTYIWATVVAVSPAFAQTITPDSAEAQALAAFQHAPMRRAPGAPGALVSNGSVQTYNWTGYAVTGTDFTDAKGSWIVPTGTCSKSPNAWASFWVGIDGYSDATVEQVGTVIWCNRTTPVYYTYYELYPAPATYISSISAKPGDKMFAEVSYKGTEFTLEIKDETTGKSFSITKSVSGAKRTSAEWIVEAPTASCCGILNLADFTKAKFGDDYTGVTDTSWATDSKVSGPISDFGSAVEKITQVDDTLYIEATPSALTDGSSFTATWVEYN
jgi:Peptidase A4 family